MHTFPTLTRREFLAVAAGLLATGSARAAGSSDDILIGLCSGFDSAEKVKTGGVDYIEENFQKLTAPNDPDDKVLPRLEAAAKAALPVYSCNGFLPASLRVVGTDANHDGVVKFCETGFPRAAKAGIKVVVFGSGGARKLADGFSRDEAMKQMIALGKRIAPIADEIMKGAGYQAPNPGGDDPNFPSGVLAGSGQRMQLLPGGAAPSPEMLQEVAAGQANTSPTFPPVPAVGRTGMQGVETFSVADNFGNSSK